MKLLLQSFAHDTRRARGNNVFMGYLIKKVTFTDDDVGRDSGVPPQAADRSWCPKSLEKGSTKNPQ